MSSNADFERAISDATLLHIIRQRVPPPADETMTLEEFVPPELMAECLQDAAETIPLVIERIRDALPHLPNGDEIVHLIIQVWRERHET
jgi:hypothetical protein